MPVAVFVGHSYVRRMKEYLAVHPEVKNGPPGLVWKYIGIGGAKLDPELPNFANISHYLPEIVALRPTVIFVHMGENDLMSSLPHEIVDDMLTFVQRLVVACKPARVIIGQLLAFPKNSPLGEASRYVNKQLREFCKCEANQPLPTRIQFWKQKLGVFGPNAAEHFIDGVHLDNKTTKKYCVSVGTIVSRCYNAWLRERQH